MADVGEEETLVDGDVCGVLIGGGVSGALIGVPLPANMGIAALLLVISLLLLLLPPLVIIPVTITRQRAFSDKMTGLTTFVANLLGNLMWTRRLGYDLYNAYPIYDWTTEDIWTAYARFKWPFNQM